MLPIFPAVNLLSAWFLVHAFERRKILFPLFSALSVFLHLIFTFSLHPYYLAHYNRVFFTPSSAQYTFSIGWGEGLEEAASYINQKEGSQNLRISSWYPEVFKLFSHSKVYDLSFAKNADYVVFYVNQIQRRLFPEILKIYEKRPPEHIIKINGIEYVRIYKNI
jgi:hypothetical protein